MNELIFTQSDLRFLIEYFLSRYILGDLNENDKAAAYNNFELLSSAFSEQFGEEAYIEIIEETKNQIQHFENLSPDQQTTYKEKLVSTLSEITGAKYCPNGGTCHHQEECKQMGECERRKVERFNENFEIIPPEQLKDNCPICGTPFEINWKPLQYCHECGE